MLQDINVLISKDDHVKVVVLKVDPKTKKIAVGMKPSYFTSDDMRESDDEAGKHVESSSEEEDEADDEGAQSVKKDLLEALDDNAVGAVAETKKKEKKETKKAEAKQDKKTKARKAQDLEEDEEEVPVLR